MLSFKYIFLIIFMLTCDQQDANAQIVIKFSHIATADSPKGLAAIHFKEVAEKLTKGKVRVDVYPDSQLFKDNEEMEALQLNSVQMLAPSFSKFSSLGIHDFEVFDLPYLFRNQDDLHRITHGPVGRKLLSILEPQGIVGLGYWDNGFKNMSANIPIHVPNDMRGLKMRIPPSKVISTQMSALGAIPFSMPFFETYKFLNNGLIDGTETTPSLFYTLDLIKSQKYLSMTNHGYLGYVVIMNKKFWDSLPAEIQIQLTAAMSDTTKYANMVAKQQNDVHLAAIKNSGKTTVIELTEAEKNQWRAALLPVKNKIGNRISKELLDEIRRELPAQ
jgi:C4-dicarboxylate-binding protein DctP